MIGLEIAAPTPTPKGRLRHKLPTAFLVAVLLGLSGWICRVPILKGLAHAWIINDPVTKADAIVVLGGGVDTRPFAAARLYHQGFAPRILIMFCETNSATELGLTPSEDDLTRKVLESQNVPPSAITVVGRGVASTFEESIAVHEWGTTNRIKTLIIPTELFHTRRVRWVFRRTFKDSGVRFILVPIPGWNYDSDNWWLHEGGVTSFQNELVKSVFYHLRY